MQPHLFRLGLIATAMMVVALEAQAQTQAGPPVGPPDGVPSGTVARVGDTGIRLKSGQSLWITTTDGTQQQGRLLALSPSTVTLLVSDTRISVPFSSIRLIQKPDSLRNGMTIGAICGGAAMSVLGVLGALVGSEDESVEVAAAIGAGAVGAGLGTLVGAFVDVQIQGRQTVYRSPGNAPIFVAPILTKRGAGIAVRVTWR